MIIETATRQHIPSIREIAEQTWPHAYGKILKPEQIEYMLNMMYSADALDEQMNAMQHHFLIARDDASSQYQGFVSYQTHYKHLPKTKIHKLYVLPTLQGSGMGRALVEAVCHIARQQGDTRITLNMNRSNPSLRFYERMGFAVAGEEDIDIGNGFVMEDYILEKLI